jgi:tetratricopeptide (TPR) repeat protein
MAFRDGLRNDPHNVAVYYGLDQALSILNRPAKERVEALEKYPDADMPSDLVYELILNLAEQGSYDRATALFHDRFFPRQEGGTNVRQVWIEVKLDHSLMLGRDGRCGEALNLERNLGSPVVDLSFTRDGLDSLLESARIHYLRASILSRCGRPSEASEHLRRASMTLEPDEIVWASMAARKLPGFNAQSWNERLRNARARLAGNTEPSAWRFYEFGVLDAALGRKDQARLHFRNVFLWPDRSLVYHLTRLAQSASID